MIYAGNAKKLYGLAEARVLPTTGPLREHAGWRGTSLPPVDDIPPGGRKLVEVNGRAVVVFNLGGEFFALNNRCPHRGGSLCDGKQTGLVQSSEPGDYQYTPQGRDHPLPVALLGVRHPHRAVLVRSRQGAHAPLRGLGGAGRAAGRRPVQGRDLSGQRRERLRGGRGLSCHAPRTKPREVYFEFTAIGAVVKVVAIDAATGTEVSVMGPASAAHPTSSGSPWASSRRASPGTPSNAPRYSGHSPIRSPKYLALGGRADMVSRQRRDADPPT